MITPGTAILVTGATGSIGFEIAAQAAEQDGVVGVHGSSESSAQAALERLRARVPGARLVAAPADYRQPGAIGAMVHGFAAAAGRIDAVVDCAIAGPEGVTGPFANLDPDVFAPHAAAAIAAVQTLCHACIPHLSKQGGALVAFASDSGRFAAPRQSVVGASRAGIIGFVRNIGLELARDGIRVNCISPSFVEDTSLFERFHRAAEGRVEASRRRAGLGLPRPADIAPLALFLAGPNSAKITGQVISVNGGLNA